MPPQGAVPRIGLPGLGWATGKAGWRARRRQDGRGQGALVGSYKGALAAYKFVEELIGFIDVQAFASAMAALLPVRSPGRNDESEEAERTGVQRHLSGRSEEHQCRQ